MKGPVLEGGAIIEALQALLEPGDAVALESDNQKQADFLSRSLVQVDPAKVHDLHLLISSVSRPEHLTLFERGIARKLDLAYAGPQSVRLAQLAGQYGIDLFIGSTLQLDAEGNSSTVTRGRLAGFGGALNMGSDARGRRHTSAAWLEMIPRQSATARGRKLVVQAVETFHKGGQPTIVDTLDAVAVGKKARMPVAPVMIYGNDVTPEAGVAYLYKTEGLEERRAAIAAIAGATEIGRRADPKRTAELRSRGIVATPEDLGFRRAEARRSLLAARSIDDLVAWSDGLYQPPAKFRS